MKRLRELQLIGFVELFIISGELIISAGSCLSHKSNSLQAKNMEPMQNIFICYFQVDGKISSLPSDIWKLLSFN